MTQIWETGSLEGQCGYRVTGAGPAVLLVHGFPFDGSIWMHTAGTLSSGFRVIIPDLAAWGLSKRLPLPATLDGLADQVYQVLVREQAGPAVLFGHSLGGYVVLSLAARYPDAFLGIGLVHSTAEADSPGKRDGRVRAMEMIRSQGSLPYLEQMIPSLFSATFALRHPDILEKLIRQFGGIDPKLLLGYQQIMLERPDRCQVLKQARVPVLFAAGKLDPVVPPDAILPQMGLPRVASILWMEEAAHMGMYESPDELEQSLNGFAGFCFNHRFEVNL
ncbi:MAG TPA: alpha/beta hydrolase [Chitinophagaceae bacterium]|nr:alpha/beta hydrolase [Chitinophagaceae bacterium]